jgi:hypothetical protein
MAHELLTDDGAEELAFRRPQAGEYGEFYHKYISLVPDGDLRRLLPVIFDGNFRVMRSIPADMERHRYASGKWSIREMIGHMIDTERVFSYRAMRVARGDTTPLPGFDENTYTAMAHYDDIPLDQILGELMAVHASTVMLFENLRDDAWDRRGVASNHPISVRALAYMIAGHELHHMNLLRDRYGISV